MSSSPTSSFSSEAGVTAVPARRDSGPAPASPEPSPAFGPFGDVQCAVEVTLGTGTITVRELLALARDRVVELAESAGTNLAVEIAGVRLAAGEVVMVDDRAALRITQILPPAGVETP